VSIAFVQEAFYANAGGNSLTTAVTQGSAATAGNVLIAICAINRFESISGVADSQGNSYTQRLSDLVVGGRSFRIYTAIASASNVITFTMTQGVSNNQGLACLREVSGAAASPYDNAAQATQTSPGTGSDILSSGNLTPNAQPGLLNIFGWNDTSTTIPTAGTIGTNAMVNSGSAGGNMGGEFVSSYKPVSSLSAVAGTFSLSAGSAQTYATLAVLLDQIATASGNQSSLLLGVG
jgi:hypothetical protein